MDQKQRVIIGLIVVIAIAGAALGIQVFAANQVAPQAPLEENVPLNISVNATSFIYGPQDWKPGLPPLPLVPATIPGAGNFSVLFVDLNATPKGVAGTLPVIRPVAVDYRFSGLSGMAAFHVYGYSPGAHGERILGWTNRVDGDGSTGYYVTGTGTPGGTGLSAKTLAMPNGSVIVYNNPAALYASGFKKEGGGLNAIHITTDPGTPEGQVTVTGEQAGRFYVTATGNQPLDSVILLVAVNQTQDDRFALSLAAHPVTGESGA